MRAIVIHRHGGPEVLTYEPRWPDPVPGPDDIVVRVHACALNPLDIFTREGMPGEPTPLPHITGGDIAGVVAAVGAEVRTPRVGDRVMLNPSWGCGRCEYCRDGEVPKCLRVHMLGEMDPGGLAEYVRCPARQAIPVPDSYPLEQAACLPITFGTAWRMLVTHARVRPGEDVLVHGAVGGVGLAAVQIAKLAGAHVLATASTAEKLDRATELGADATINYAEDVEWDVTVRRLTGKRGVDVIVETVGAATWERSIRALGKGGRLVTSGATSGPIGATDVRYLFRREQTIQGSNGWTHNDLLTIARLAFAGRLRPVVDRVLPLEQAADGERAMERREVIGKVVIRP
ncbi:MAG TPA: zinc-binding dehydrogenase [Methylomirabilota bacterium]|nr:zinc-binding dehydrogenase [Methylomirabilota bacterium]